MPMGESERAMPHREYPYIGPAEFATAAIARIEQLCPTSQAEIQQWLIGRACRTATFTFVVDRGGALWLSERGTEHGARRLRPRGAGPRSRRADTGAAR